MYLIYGKHLRPWTDKKGKLRDPDATFRALDYRGVRVTRLADAKVYNTREEAQAVLDKPKTRAWIEQQKVCFEIRPV